MSEGKKLVRLGSKPLRRSNRVATIWRKPKPNAEPIMVDLTMQDDEEVTFEAHEDHDALLDRVTSEVEPDTDINHAADSSPKDIDNSDEVLSENNEEQYMLLDQSDVKVESDQVVGEASEHVANDDLPQVQQPKRRRTDANEVQFQSLRTRTSPKAVVRLFANLTRRQKQAVSEMGFESMLKLSIEEIPGPLAYYVVDHLDTVNMCIRTQSGNISINRRSVHKVLGFPLGTIAITNDTKAYYDHRVSKRWKKHMGLRGGAIRPKHVVDKIQSRRTSGYLFKLDFLVLLVTTMVGGTRLGTVNQKFLHAISRDTDVKELDWCRYVVDAVRECKDGWLPNNSKSFFIGPITFLILLYCDAMVCNVPDIPRTRPVVVVWRTEQLKQRQGFEVCHGGFGMLDMHDEYKNRHDSEEDDSDAEIENDIQGVANELLNYIRTVEQSKPKMELKLASALDFYENSDILTEVKSKWDSLFGKQTAVPLTSNDVE